MEKIDRLTAIFEEQANRLRLDEEQAFEAFKNLVFEWKATDTPYANITFKDNRSGWVESKNLSDFLVEMIQKNEVQSNVGLSLRREKGLTEHDAIKWIHFLINQTNGDVLSEQGDHGNSILHCAALENLSILAEYLVAQGADVNALNNRLNTPLMMASFKGHAKVVTLLLSTPQIQVDLRDKNKGTALHDAARCDQLEVLKLLLQAGADEGLKNDEDQTPLDEALGNGHEAIVSFLKGYIRAKKERQALENVQVNSSATAGPKESRSDQKVVSRRGLSL